MSAGEIGMREKRKFGVWRGREWKCRLGGGGGGGGETGQGQDGEIEMGGIWKGWLGDEILDMVPSGVEVKFGSGGGRQRGGREGVSIDFRKRGKSSGEFRRCGRTCKRDFGVGEIREWGVVKRGRRAMEEEVGKVDGWVLEVDSA